LRGGATCAAKQFVLRSSLRAEGIWTPANLADASLKIFDLLKMTKPTARRSRMVCVAEPLALRSSLCCEAVCVPKALD